MADRPPVSTAAQPRPSFWRRLDERLARLQHVLGESHYGADPLPYEEWKAWYYELPEQRRG